MPRKPAPKAAPKAAEKTANVLLRITPEEHLGLRKLAAAHGKPMAVFLRDLIRGEVERSKGKF